MKEMRWFSYYRFFRKTYRGKPLHGRCVAAWLALRERMRPLPF